MLMTTEPSGESRNILRLAGEASIVQARELKDALLEALQGSEAVEVDISGLESIDFYALQLLCAAHRCAITQGKCLSFRGVAADDVSRIMALAGFLRQQGCSHCPKDVKCLWTP